MCKNRYQNTASVLLVIQHEVDLINIKLKLAPFVTPGSTPNFRLKTRVITDIFKSFLRRDCVCAMFKLGSQQVNKMLAKRKRGSGGARQGVGQL